VDEKMATKKIFERKKDCKRNFETQIYIAGRCRERFRGVEIEEIKVKGNLEGRTSISYRWT
jgi:hypothetical protein